MTSPIAAVSEEVATSLSNFRPENVTDLRDGFRDLPDLFRVIRQGLSGMTERFADETPVHADVIEHMREMFTALDGLADHADSLGPLFEERHREELKRIDEPRPGEEILDVQSNR